MILFGPDMTELREQAKAAAMQHFVALGDRDGVPPTLRAMYVRKAEQARIVQDGGSSSLIEGEAAVRGITPLQMAQVVLAMAAAGGDELEIERMRTNVAIDAAQDESELMGILDQHGIKLSINT